MQLFSGVGTYYPKLVLCMFLFLWLHFATTEDFDVTSTSTPSVTRDGAETVQSTTTAAPSTPPTISLTQSSTAELTTTPPVQTLAVVPLTRSAGDEFITEEDFVSQDSRPESLPSPEIYSLRINSDIAYRYATTVVYSKVANPAKLSQQVHFAVVLPETAFISGFVMVIEGKEYKAYVKEKEEAKAEYMAAVKEHRTAAHIELSARDSNSFSVSVNIGPLSKVSFNLTYEELLSRTLGLYTHTINLNPKQIVKDMSVTVNIRESANITVLQVPNLRTSNEIVSEEHSADNSLAVISRESGELATVTWAPTATQQLELARDGVKGQLVIRYDVDRVSQPQQILVDEGYFVHFFAPALLPALRKHVIFVLDQSGSMYGRKLEQLKEAMSRILSDLNQGDFFSLIMFSNSAHAWLPSGTNVPPGDGRLYYVREETIPQEPSTADNIVPATEEKIALAKEFVKQLNDMGGTNIIAGLRKGLQLAELGKSVLGNNSENNSADALTVEAPEPMIIFLTDGEPNIEMSDTDEIIQTVKELNILKCAIFSLAFGEGADLSFLRKLSISNSGFARNIYEASDAALQLNNFYKQVASPLLANVSFHYIPGQVGNETTQCVFPRLFSGTELVVAGRLVENSSHLNAQLTARSPSGPSTFDFIEPPFVIGYPEPENRTHGHLERLWAYLSIQQLLEKDSVSKDTFSKQKALDLALKYSFVTPLTSMVVVKPNETTAIDTETSTPVRGRVSMMASLPHSSGSQYPLSYAMPAMPYPAISKGQSASPTGLEAPEADLELSVVEMNIGPTKVNVSQLQWLDKLVKPDGVHIILPDKSNGTKEYILGLNETDMVFSNCTTPAGGSGNCRHLVHCSLSTFIDTLQQFLPYFCAITSSYVGVCCPVEVNNSVSPFLHYGK